MVAFCLRRFLLVSIVYLSCIGAVNSQFNKLNLFKKKTSYINEKELKESEDLDIPNYYDTTIARLINKKINEYRVENGLHELIETDSLRNEVDAYTKSHSDNSQHTNIIRHSKTMKNSEVICYSPASANFVTKKDGYTHIFSADSIATGIIEAYKNSPGHNHSILSKAHTKFITSVYVYYHYKKGFESWAVFTATELLNPDWDLYLKYEKNSNNDENE